MDHVKKKIKTTLAAIILATFSLGVSLLISEMVIRQFYPIETGISFLQYRIPHGVLGWSLEPGVSYVNVMQETEVLVQYNSNGWRDAEHDIENQEGKFRILVLGDSYMEAYSVGLKDTFFQQLENLSQNRGLDIKTINLGVGGYGTLQEYLAFDTEGRKFEPDLVLLGFYIGNDLRNNDLNIESVIYKDSMKVNSRPFLVPLEESGWKITQVDFDSARNRYLAAKRKQESLTERLKRNSALIQATVNVFERSRKPVLGRGKHSTNHNDPRRRKKIKNMEYLARYGQYYCNEPPEFTRAWDTTKRILNRLNNEVSEMGSTLVVFSVPAIHEVDTVERDKVTENAPEGETLCLESPPAYAHLRSILTDLSIKYIDLLPEFRDEMQNGGTNLYRRSDRHWNEKGHRLAAEIVFSTLTDEQLFTPIRNDDISSQ